jgi:microcystin-dependent protein
MAQLAPFFNGQFLDNLGAVAAGHLLHTYDSGTTTPKITYTDQAGAVPNTNPIALDSAGRCSLWLGTGEYSFELRTAGGALVKRWDDVGGVPAPDATPYLPLAGGEAMTGLFTLSGNATANLHPTPLQQVNSLISSAISSISGSLSGQTPAGTIALWLTGTPPTGWLELRGGNVSRTTYAALFAVWGTTFGAGDGSTTFGLPEVRGEFPRFWDNARGVDTGRTLGSAQDDLVKNHTHTVEVFGGEALAAGSGNNYAPGSTLRTTNNNASGGTENRPRNVAFMAIVKAV